MSWTWQWRHVCVTYKTRHRASTSMYLLTFCIRVMSPERHHWKPAVQAATVMLRTPPPSTASYQPASHAHFPYTARNFENASRHPPVTGQQRAQTLPSVRTMSSYRGMDASLWLVFALCCHSNATRAPIANLPNCAQLGGSLYQAPKLHPGPCSSVGVRLRTDRQTHTHIDTQTCVTTIHFASSTTHAKSNK